MFKKLIKWVIDNSLLKLLIYLRNRLQKPERLKKRTIYDVIWEQAILDSAVYVQQYLDVALLFKEKHQLWDYALSKIEKRDGLHLEFGVFKGKSINYFAKKMPGKKFYGFDSFEGLAEDWLGHHSPKGTFDLEGNLPKVEPNVSLISGWYNNTATAFLSQKPDEVVLFLHVDCDTYESTTTVLNAVDGRLSKGSIIVFDEYLGYPNWKQGEFLAWKNFSERTGTNYRYLGFSTEQVVLEII